MAAPVPENLENFLVRAPTMGDLEAVTRMLNECSMVDQGLNEETVEDLRKQWQTPGFNLETDVRIVADLDGQIAGYVEVWNLSEPHVKAFAWGRVHPAFRGRGIGSYLIRLSEERAGQTIALAPAGARVAVYNDADAKNKAAQGLFERHGYAPIRHFRRMLIEMEAPPPAPHWPTGIAVRTLVRGQDERAIHAASEEAFQDHWGSLPVPFEQWQHRIMRSDDFDPALWFLAIDGDQIAGTCLCNPKAIEDPDMGWVASLSVRRPWRRRGLGLALLRHAFGEFYRRGTRKAGLGVDASSLTGATRLYERAGMHVAREFIRYEKELRPGVELSTQSVSD
jgi:mycothiol synthase